ncbi:MAG: glycoside hydrolase family 10 protein [Gemmataceae bacterium]
MFLTMLLSTVMAPAPTAEFRGVWVATVANIDWPSKPGLPAEVQQAELRAVLDRCKDLNLNAVIFQVRPMCDALYESKLEPWSGFLTGTPGQSPGYDPLALAVTEAHARGLQLHAWLNPYRAYHPSAQGELPATHLVKARPDIAKKYGKHYWLNPTHPDTICHTIAIARDIITRYKIDGIHMDDYFYPYPETDDAKKEIPFPDDDTWEKYQTSGGLLSRGDWRRDAVNRFVKELYHVAHQTNPKILVGISPFGIYRPGTPPGIAGFDQYDRLYADAKLWLQEGWVDYFTPQLYWATTAAKQPYGKLLEWWTAPEQNPKGRHLWIGNSSSRHDGAEMTLQVTLTRKQAGGNVWFSWKSLTGTKADALKNQYPSPAPIPATPWLK